LKCKSSNYLFLGESGTIQILTLIHQCVQRRVCTLANKEQRKAQKAPPKSNKQKKEMQKEKKAAKSAGTGISLKKE
jgi:hypothetical protein